MAKFYKSVLTFVPENEVLNEVYPTRIAKQLTLDERLPNGLCEMCNGDEWIILSKESSIVKESGKPYIECMNCGSITHL